MFQSLGDLLVFLHCLIMLIQSEKQIKLPEVPLDMSVCDGSDNEDLEVKQEPIDSDTVKSEEFPPELKSEDSKSDSKEVVSDGHFQKFTGSGK